MTRSRCYVRGYVQRTDGDGGDGNSPVTFIAATEGRKADGIDLRMDNVDLSRFTANPVIGYGHDYFGRDSLPIGRAVTTDVDGPRLRQQVEFDQADEFATKVESKVRGGYLNAVSIGFEAFDIGEDGVPARWELFETSVVPLPLDPAAVAESRDLELARALGEVRAGKTLSAKNKKLVADAAAALSALLDAAGGNDDEEDDSGRSSRRHGRGAISGHSTAVVDTEWDGPGAVADAPEVAATLRYMHAWVDPDGDPDAKASYSLPHHAAGTDTAANASAVRNALARLPQSNIPDDDQTAVERHLRRHLDDFNDDDDEDDAGRGTPRRAAARRKLALHQAL